MKANNFQKGYEYSKVKTDKDDNLLWIKNIVNDLWNENKIATTECVFLINSLYPKGKIK